VTPPLALTVELYGVLTLPPGSDVVVIASAVLIVMLRLAMAEVWVVSVTFTVKADVPVALGVPVITPVAAFKVKFAGNVPMEMLQV
jgi:hypothetical protein